MPDLRKAYAISDAKISFVSLVDKAANKREFLITKAENDGAANFTSMGEILKTDKAQHYVTGVVYEPMTEDSHKNYMTAEEIEKAAHWFAKSGSGIDLQHNFKPLDNAAVVESYILPSDCLIGNKPVKKGAWIMTIEVDDEIFEKVEKREITGLSMGGVGNYSNVDVKLDDVTKSEGVFENFLNGLTEFISGKIKKGDVSERYKKSIKHQNIYTAFEALSGVLYRYDPMKDEYVYETDGKKIKEALIDFNAVVTELLSSSDITKALTEAEKPDTIIKAGAKMSAKNLSNLKDIHTKISELISSVETKKEDDEDMSKDDVVKAVNEALEPITKSLDEITKSLNAGSDQPQTDNNAVTSAEVAEIVTKAIAPITEQIEKIAKAKGLPSNLGSGEEAGEVKKESRHYMADILGL